MLNDKFAKGKGIAREVPTGSPAIVLSLDYSAVASNTSTKNLSGYGVYSWHGPNMAAIHMVQTSLFVL